MSRPPLNPEKTAAGIAVDPQTLERVIPESRRPDGTVRKQIKIRPGFTPQEDVRRFRGTKQQQMDSNVLPKGHVVGWAPPPSSTPASTSGKALSKSAKKNAKRKEKRDEKKTEPVKESWEDDDEADTPAPKADADGRAAESKPSTSSDITAATDTSPDALASGLEKLKVK
ncbi:hypothetical protein BDZ89DRAFT_975473 [Hymenopellis radicata]|nr:hypothetical protein BDZ89DRAFT_975473 [Hymenopellis radicata]